MKNCIKMRQGFTMIEVLLTLMVTSLCSLLFAQIIMIMTQINRSDYQVEDDLAIKQLQVLFAQGSAFAISEDVCQLSYHGETISLLQYENKLVKRAGFEVFLQDIDDVSFIHEGGCVYVSWRRKEQTQQTMLGCE